MTKIKLPQSFQALEMAHYRPYGFARDLHRLYVDQAKNT